MGTFLVRREWDDTVKILKDKKKVNEEHYN